MARLSRAAGQNKTSKPSGASKPNTNRTPHMVDRKTLQKAEINEVRRYAKMYKVQGYEKLSREDLLDALFNKNVKLGDGFQISAKTERRDFNPHKEDIARKARTFQNYGFDTSGVKTPPASPPPEPPVPNARKLRRYTTVGGTTASAIPPGVFMREESPTPRKDKGKGKGKEVESIASSPTRDGPLIGTSWGQFADQDQLVFTSSGSPEEWERSQENHSFYHASSSPPPSRPAPPSSSPSPPPFEITWKLAKDNEGEDVLETEAQEPDEFAVENLIQYEYPVVPPLEPNDPKWLEKMMGQLRDERRVLSTYITETREMVNGTTSELVLARRELAIETGETQTLIEHIREVAGPKFVQHLFKLLDEGAGNLSDESDFDSDEADKENIAEDGNIEDLYTNADDKPGPSRKREREDDDEDEDECEQEERQRACKRARSHLQQVLKPLNLKDVQHGTRENGRQSYQFGRPGPLFAPGEDNVASKKPDSLVAQAGDSPMRGRLRAQSLPPYLGREAGEWPVLGEFLCERGWLPSEPLRGPPSLDEYDLAGIETSYMPDGPVSSASRARERRRLIDENFDVFGPMQANQEPPPHNPSSSSSSNPPAAQGRTKPLDYSYQQIITDREGYSMLVDERRPGWRLYLNKPGTSQGVNGQVELETTTEKEDAMLPPVQGSFVSAPTS